MPGEVPVNCFRAGTSGGTSLDTNVEVRIMQCKHFISRVFIWQSKHYTSAGKPSHTNQWSKSEWEAFNSDTGRKKNKDLVQNKQRHIFKLYSLLHSKIESGYIFVLYISIIYIYVSIYSIWTSWHSLHQALTHFWVIHQVQHNCL